MKPLTAEEKRALLDAHPPEQHGGLHRDLAEYERLLACVFASDPSTLGPGGFLATLDPARRRRLRTLHERIFQKTLPA